MRIELLDRARCAEAAHADEDAVLADEAVPIAAHRGLDGNANLLGAEHLFPVSPTLLLEELHRGDRYDARRDAGLVEQGLGIDCDLDFRARREDNGLRLFCAGGDLISAL